jgi:succinate-semialdehyde dehydrogenase/glutarate-semialdehyde dehydrogenase
MELGGNAPFVVLSDADLDEAVAGALVAKLRHGGSACTAANRFIVHASLADEFTRRFAEAMRSLPVGPGLDEATKVGPLLNAKTRDKVAELVQSALDAGADPVAGASAPDRVGYYYNPTVLGGVPQDAHILSQEIFGPVAPVARTTTSTRPLPWRTTPSTASCPMCTRATCAPVSASPSASTAAWSA